MSFRSDPKNFLAEHRCTLSFPYQVRNSMERTRLFQHGDGGAQIQDNNDGVRYRDGWSSYQYRIRTHLDFMVDTTSAQTTIRMVDSANDVGVRYLPWDPNAVTYLKVDGQAKWFFTGPLQGCHVYVGYDTDGNPWCFHVNRNNVEAQDGNAQAKKTMVMEQLRRLGGQVIIRHTLLAKDYAGSQAIVLGRKRPINFFNPTEVWKFYFHAYTLENITHACTKFSD